MIFVSMVDGPYSDWDIETHIVGVFSTFEEAERAAQEVESVTKGEYRAMDPEGFEVGHMDLKYWSEQAEDDEDDDEDEHTIVVGMEPGDL